MPRVITLTTDFGLRDPFVGIMKGVLLSICPSARLVDLTHEVPPHDILAGGLALEAATPFFPPGTVHLAVVDPGVGSARRAIAVRAGGYHLVGPDNGLFTFALEGAGWTAVSVTAPEYRLAEVGRTFHGRDIFAPAAAYLAAGVPLERLGPPVSDPERLR
ncbi:MAG: SAM hydrolase/SAM-dependent halogenase family protein, partial [Candidatus Rokuibacteriota bacterium]